MTTLLTTVDNPYSPFTHWDQWYSYDQAHGYDTPGLLARTTITSDELSDVDVALSIDQAMNTIVKENVSGIHRKVSDSN